ncbi:MAG: bifunctional phosphoribosylaminoimidazolecarboxamide formyltransferase/IMP cyclohydrolase [Actinomycetota bacterium]
MSQIRVERALVSVSDKTGIAEFARRLSNAGVEIVSSGGTAQAIADAGVPVTPVAEVTGAAEMLGGRVKTLHPNIHGGILADHGKPEHQADLTERGIEAFQLVVVNLYPFEETVAHDPPPAEAIEQIDIGGPAMIRAAAKNHAWVGVVVSPDRYDQVAAAVKAGGLEVDLREALAREAFARTAAYDAAIVSWLDRDESLPDNLPLALTRHDELRYGENPHQSAAIYAEYSGKGWWSEATQLQGKAMSFNNYADTEAAWRLAADLAKPGAVIVKHMNACGAAEASDGAAAFRDAWDCDPLSAFGGVIALNTELDEATAEEIAPYFVEVVIAPAVTEVAHEVLARKKNLRILTAPFPGTGDLDIRRIEGGLLVQERDRVDLGDAGLPDDWTIAGARTPTDQEIEDLRFAWMVAAHTKSNAIVVARDRAAIGVGAGDQSRVGAAQRAIAKAGDRSTGAVAASDAFFPFRDGVDMLAEAGVTAVVEPGGSVRDDEVVAAADDHGMAIVFTHRRHFRH